MTTIATDGKSMAGDGRVTSCHSIITEGARKVHQLHDGRIVGCCGVGHDIIRVVAWLNAGGRRPKVSRDFGAIILSAEGVEWVTDTLLPEPAQAPLAIGSGMAFAIGAMEVGASPEQAVAAASRRDPSTGGTITVEHLQ